MNMNPLLVACCTLLWTNALAAQAPATADPISGKWTGAMGPGATPGFHVTFDLKFDGKAAVTGTLSGLPTPGEIRSGSFDPSTGALKLEAAPTDGAPLRLVLEGTVVAGTATGRVTGDNQVGTFILTKSDGAPTGAQQAATGDAVAALRRNFAEVSGWIARAADLVPADKYTYRPAPTVRTFGQLIGHIADGLNYYCARAGGRNVEWSDPIEKGSTDKAALAPKLKQSIDACNAVFGGSGQVGPLTDNVAHTSLHYGNVITYLRTMGLTPPSS